MDLCSSARPTGRLETEFLVRRLSDKVLVAFHQACDHHDVAVARGLMAVLELMWLRDLDAPWGRRRNVNWLLPARERLLHEIARAEGSGVGSVSRCPPTPPPA